MSQPDDMYLAASSGPVTEIAMGETAGGAPLTAPAGPAMAGAIDRDGGLLADQTGTLRRQVFVLALPVLGEQVLNTFVAWNDTYLAGHLNVSATAAVGFSA